MQKPSLESWIKILTPAGAVVAFYQFMSNDRSQAETRKTEATRPFLDWQLKLYTEAAQAAATISTASSKEKIIQVE